MFKKQENSRLPWDAYAVRGEGRVCRLAGLQDSRKPTPYREGGSPPSSGTRSTERLTLWHHRPPGDSPEWQGPFLSSGVLRSWQRTKNIPIFGKCLLSTFDAPDTARNGGCDSEDRRHSGLNALSESPGPGVLTGFLEARPALPKPETLSLC